MNIALMPLPYTPGESDSAPLDVSEEECELTENEVDMLMDALDDDDDDNDSTDNNAPSSAKRADSSYSFSLPLDSEAPQNEDEDASSEPSDPSDEPLVAPSAGIPKDKVLRKRVKQDNDESSPSKSVKESPVSARNDEWDETRAVSHLLSSPYDASFGLLSRVDTR